MPGGLLGRDHLQLLRNRGMGVASELDAQRWFGNVLDDDWPRFRRPYGLLR